MTTLDAAIPEDVYAIGWSIAQDIPPRVKDDNREFCARLIARAIMADRKALPRPADIAEAVGVKPLEWHKHQRDDLERYSAEPTFASYIITWTASGYELYIGFWGSAAEPRPPFFVSVDEAKAAAQADYERRIRSALASSPAASPSPGWNEAVETCVLRVTLHRGNVRSEDPHYKGKIDITAEIIDDLRALALPHMKDGGKP